MKEFFGVFPRASLKVDGEKNSKIEDLKLLGCACFRAPWDMHESTSQP